MKIIITIYDLGPSHIIIIIYNSIHQYHYCDVRCEGFRRIILSTLNYYSYI